MMSTTQRVAVVFAAQARRTGRIHMTRMMRHLELECRTREEAEEVADVVASLLPDPLRGRLGVVELLLNAIEHGNLEIGKALKCRLIRAQQFTDEVAARLEREPYRSRRVHVRVAIEYPDIEIEIRDEGPGFAWRHALASDIEVDECPNGRGISLVSQTCFPGLTYRDPGNVAIIKVTWPR